MATDTTWELDAETVSHLVVGDTVFEDVITTVLWTCIAFDGPLRSEITGAHKLPAPTNQAQYIDLASVRALGDVERRLVVTGWAEILDPGFVARTEAAAIALVDAKREVPVIQRVAILRRSQPAPPAVQLIGKAD